MPKQIQVKAMSPLCHTSVSKWALAAGATIKSDAKIERCAKVAGEVAYTVTRALNEYFAGKWTPPVWKPSAQIEHCISCHGPERADAKGAQVEPAGAHGVPHVPRGSHPVAGARRGRRRPRCRAFRLPHFGGWVGM